MFGFGSRGVRSIAVLLAAFLSLPALLSTSNASASDAGDSEGEDVIEGIEQDVVLFDLDDGTTMEVPRAELREAASRGSTRDEHGRAGEPAKGPVREHQGEGEHLPSHITEALALGSPDEAAIVDDGVEGAPDEETSTSTSGFTTLRQVPKSERESRPRRAVAQVLYADHNAVWHVCSAWMLKEDRVITASHCVRDLDGNWYPGASYRIGPAAHEGWTPYQWCRSVQRISPSNYRTESTEAEKAPWDYAGIKLDCDVGWETGWFGYWWSDIDPEHDWRARGGSNTGYWNIDRKMYEGFGEIYDSAPQLVWYSNAGSRGMSGGPRWNDYTQWGNAVHAIHQGASPIDRQGVRINETVFDQIYGWKYYW